MSKKYTDEELIQIIKDKAIKLGRPPQRRELKCFNAVILHFGSFNNGLIAAGLVPRTIKNMSKDDMLESIRKWSKKHGKTPSISEWIESKKNGEYIPELRHMQRTFGDITWNKLLKLAGLEINEESKVGIYDKYSDKELLQILKNELKRLNTNKWLDYERNRNKEYPSVTFYKRRFKCSWNKLLKKAGYKDNEINNIRRTKEELIKMLKNIAKEIGHTPSITELSKLGHNEGLFKDNFSSYNEAVRLAGLKPNTSPVDIKETNEELLQMYIDFSNKIGKSASFNDLNKSNEVYNADVFCIRFGGMVELKKLAGFTTMETSNKKYTKKILKEMLLEEYNRLGRQPSNNELRANKSLPSLNTFLRYFKTTKMSEVWEEVLR